MAKDRKGFSRWTEDSDTGRWQGIGKEEEEEIIFLWITLWKTVISKITFQTLGRKIVYVINKEK